MFTWYKSWCSVAGVSYRPVRTWAVTSQRDLPDPIPSIQVPFCDSMRNPATRLASTLPPPSRSRSPLQAHVCSQKDEDVAVMCAVIRAALHVCGCAQLFHTLDPLAPPMRKLQKKKPTSPGFSPAMFTSPSTAPGSSSLTVNMKSCICAAPASPGLPIMIMGRRFSASLNLDPVALSCVKASPARRLGAAESAYVLPRIQAVPGWTERVSADAEPTLTV